MLDGNSTHGRHVAFLSSLSHGGDANGRLPPKLMEAFALLAEARRYADDVDRSEWDFAVEIGALEAAGLTASDLRWLVCKGYVEHACEATCPGDRSRRFHPDGELTFTDRTCFILTEAGAAAAAKLLHAPVGAAFSPSSPSRPSPTSSPSFPSPPPAFFSSSSASPSPNSSVDLPLISPNGSPHLKPHWDAARRTLFYGDQVVKQYRVPCPNQEAILTAFEEEDWPPRIDDPLPPQSEQDPKRRLNDTIKSLNRHQQSLLLKFHGDGTGEGVTWESSAN